MPANPDFDAFAARYASGEPQVVSIRLVADLETPVSAMLKLAHGKANSFLLESVEGGAMRGRYAFIGFAPDLIWRCQGSRAEINRRPDADPDAFEPCAEAPLDSLRRVLRESAIRMPDGMPPMAAGLVGYMSYDMVRLMEKLPPDLFAQIHRSHAVNTSKVREVVKGDRGDGAVVLTSGRTLRLSRRYRDVLRQNLQWPL